jgi:hypothetical protein
MVAAAPGMIPRPVPVPAPLQPRNAHSQITAPRIVVKPPETAEQKKLRNFRESIRNAERSTLVFNLDMGKVPVMNKATMSKRATLALSSMAAKVEKSNSTIPSEESIEAIEDVLSMVNNMELYGTETRSYKYPNDPLTGAFYTVPVKYEFKDANIRSKAQKVLRKTCGAHCGIPYPPVVRECIRQLVARVKNRHPDNFVRVTVDTDNMVFKVARQPPKDAEDPSWQYRQGDIPIPDLALDLSLRKVPRGFKLDIPDSPSKKTPVKSPPRGNARRSVSSSSASEADTMEIGTADQQNEY